MIPDEICLKNSLISVERRAVYYFCTANGSSQVAGQFLLLCCTAPRSMTSRGVLKRQKGGNSRKFAFIYGSQRVFAAICGSNHEVLTIEPVVKWLARPPKSWLA